MNANPNEGDRPIPDDITFKTKDGNNVHIDVNVMWRIDPKKAGYLVSHVGQSVEEIRERMVRPVSRSVIRDVFNEITTEEYYQVTVKNEMAREDAEGLVAALSSPTGSSSTCSRCSSTASTRTTRPRSTPRSRPRPTCRRSWSSRRRWRSRSAPSSRGSAPRGTSSSRTRRGEAGRLRNEADGYFQTKTNEAKAVVAVAQAEAEGIRKEAEALGKMGGDAYVKMQVAKQFAQKKILIVPGSNVSTMNVNELVDYLVGRAARPSGSVVAPQPAPAPGDSGAEKR